MSFSKDTVIRFNLAWVESLEILAESLSQIKNEIYIDLPVGRTKPPNNSYDVKELKKVIKDYNNIKYVAISNVETSEQIKQYLDLFGDLVTIVPKIETQKGILNIQEICAALPDKKIIMLDHDDLFSDLTRLGINPSEFFSHINKLEIYCNQNSVRLLKTRGVIFSDEDEYKY